MDSSVQYAKGETSPQDIAEKPEKRGTALHGFQQKVAHLLPVKANEIAGQCIDIFHKNSERQRGCRYVVAPKRTFNPDQDVCDGHETEFLPSLLYVAGTVILAWSIGAQAETKHAAATAKAESPHTAVKSRVFGDQAVSGHDSGKAPAADGAKASIARTAAPRGAPKGKPSKGGHGGGWGYSGQSGPQHWSDLNPEYGLCKGGSVSIDGKTYELLQFHFHTPSEHTVEGKHFPLEMHIVHNNAHGERAVVAVFMRAGKDNIALEEVWNHLPRQAGGAKTIASVAVNARDLLPANAAYYRYMGSLTTPPCSEGVNWYVLKTPIQVGKKQIRAIADIMGANNRPTQGLVHRLLLAPE